MKAIDKINSIKEILFGKESTEIKLEQAKLDNGVMIEADSFEAGSPVFIVIEEDRQPLPPGDYALEDGTALIVQEEGVIFSVGEQKQTEEVMEEELKEEAPVKKVVESKETHFKKEEVKEEILFSKEQIEAIKDVVKEAFVELNKETKEEVEEVKEVKEELSEVKPMTHSPEKKTQKAKGFKYATNRRPGMKDRVAQMLWNNN